MPLVVIPIRSVDVNKGYKLTLFTLCCFEGDKLEYSAEKDQLRVDLPSEFASQIYSAKLEILQ